MSACRRVPIWRVMLIGILGAGVLLLSGCLRYTADLTLGSDDRVSGTLVIAKKPPSGQSGQSPPTGAAYQLTVPEPTSSSDAILVEPYDHNGDVGYKVTFERATFAEMSAFTPANSRGGTLTLNRDGARVTISMSIDLTYADNSANEQLTKNFEGTIAMRVPGDVVQTNGTVDGDRIEWTLEPLSVNSISATVDYERTAAVPATAERSTSAGVPWWMWVLVAAVLIAVLAAWLLRARRRPRHTARHALARTGSKARDVENPQQVTMPQPLARVVDSAPTGPALSSVAAGDTPVTRLDALSGRDRIPSADGWPPPRPHWRS